MYVQRWPTSLGRAYIIANYVMLNWASIMCVLCIVVSPKGELQYTFSVNYVDLHYVFTFQTQSINLWAFSLYLQYLFPFPFIHKLHLWCFMVWTSLVSPRWTGYWFSTQLRNQLLLLISSASKKSLSTILEIWLWLILSL